MKLAAAEGRQIAREGAPKEFETKAFGVGP